MKFVTIKPRVVVFTFVGIIVVSLLGYGVVRFLALQKEVQMLKSSPKAAQDAAKEDVKQLIEKIGKLIAIPKDETPTVATVNDIEKLKSSPFFTNAKNGDRVLIYTTAKKAILYRPAENKIIDVGPISIGTPSASLASASVNIVLLNGTTVTGLTKKYEAELKTVLSEAVIVDRDNAVNRELEKTIIVDIKKDKSAQVAELAKTLGIQVSPLPEGEALPKSGDFLIIVGSDKK